VKVFHDCTFMAGKSTRDLLTSLNIASHFLFSHACLILCSPPNCFISLQFLHSPQFSILHLSHSPHLNLFFGFLLDLRGQQGRTEPLSRTHFPTLWSNLCRVHCWSLVEMLSTCNFSILSFAWNWQGAMILNSSTLLLVSVITSPCLVELGHDPMSRTKLLDCTDWIRFSNTVV